MTIKSQTLNDKCKTKQTNKEKHSPSELKLEVKNHHIKKNCKAVLETEIIKIAITYMGN